MIRFSHCACYLPCKLLTISLPHVVTCLEIYFFLQHRCVSYFTHHHWKKGSVRNCNSTMYYYSVFYVIMYFVLNLLIRTRSKQPEKMHFPIIYCLSVENHEIFCHSNFTPNRFWKRTFTGSPKLTFHRFLILICKFT